MIFTQHTPCINYAHDVHVSLSAMQYNLLTMYNYSYSLIPMQTPFCYTLQICTLAMHVENIDRGAWGLRRKEDMSLCGITVTIYSYDGAIHEVYACMHPTISLHDILK